MTWDGLLHYIHLFNWRFVCLFNIKPLQDSKGCEWFILSAWQRRHFLRLHLKEPSNWDILSSLQSLFCDVIRLEMEPQPYWHWSQQLSVWGHSTNWIIETGKFDIFFHSILWLSRWDVLQEALLVPMLESQKHRRDCSHNAHLFKVPNASKQKKSPHFL